MQPEVGDDVLLSRRVVCLPYSAALRHTVEEAQSAALRTLHGGAPRSSLRSRARVATATHVQRTPAPPSPDMAAVAEEAAAEVSRSLAQCSWAPQPDLDLGAPPYPLPPQTRRRDRFRSAPAQRPPCPFAGAGARVISLAQFVQESSAGDCAVFNALHGGVGEDGRLQELLEAAGVAFTGPGSASARLCMDKASTGAAVSALAQAGVSSLPKVLVPKLELEVAAAAPEAAAALWERLCGSLRQAGAPSAAASGAPEMCLKPLADGCSTGVARIRGPAHLRLYAQAVASGAPRVAFPQSAEAVAVPEAPPRALASAPREPPSAPAAAVACLELEMPVPSPSTFLAEPFLLTDPVRVARVPGGGERLLWRGETSRFLEITAGVVRGLVCCGDECGCQAGDVGPSVSERAATARRVAVSAQVEGPDGSLQCLSPSITVKEAGDVLTLEEKFQARRCSSWRRVRARRARADI